MAVARGGAELRVFAAEWRSLAARVTEGNPFYEPFMLIPAVERLGGDIHTLFVRAASGELIGVFPLERHRPNLKVPLPHFSLWKHPYCYLCLPLLRGGAEREAVELAFAWLERAGIAGAVLRLPMVPEEATFFRIVREMTADGRRRLWTTRHYERALVQTTLTGERYEEQTLSGRRRKQLRRLWRRLGEQGALRVERREEGEEVQQGVEAFLALEQRGWKGRERTAMADHADHRAFLGALAREGAAEGKLQVWSLSLDQRPIAMALLLRSGPGLFAFKIAYDENFAAFSPGVLLDREIFGALLGQPGLAWVDSCSDPDAPTEDSQWGQRRQMCSGHVSREGWGWAGEAAVRLQVATRRTKMWLLEDPERVARLRRLRGRLRRPS